jgi:hypothetical protein
MLDPTTPVTCAGLETRVARAHVVLETCAGRHAVFREPRFGKGLALARVDSIRDRARLWRICPEVTRRVYLTRQDANVRLGLVHDKGTSRLLIPC